MAMYAFAPTVVWLLIAAALPAARRCSGDRDSGSTALAVYNARHDWGSLRQPLPSARARSSNASKDFSARCCRD